MACAQARLNGRYVDIGAQHPVVDSVSKAFYEAGWRGIHVEPVPEYATLLRQDRPDEVVLQAALSDRAGVLELNVFPDTGLSTGVKEFAERHEASQGLRYESMQVPMLPMRDALTSLAGQEVHWLKIDVEGLEEAVLRGWDSQALRPGSSSSRLRFPHQLTSITKGPKISLSVLVINSAILTD